MRAVTEPTLLRTAAARPPLHCRLASILRTAAINTPGRAPCGPSVLFTILGRYKHSRPIGRRERPAVAPYLPARPGWGYAGLLSSCDTLTQSQQVPIHIPIIIFDLEHDQNAQ